MTDTDTEMRIEMIAIDRLHPHPQNYRDHPTDQIEHIMQSIIEHGVYRNIVIANDDTILAGHGVWEASRRLELDMVPVHRLDLAPDDPQAIKVLVADNELARFADNDDRALADLLKQIRDDTTFGLVGTGYDDAMLANLVMISRPASEIADLDAAEHWVGMPDYEEGANLTQLTITFPNEVERERFCHDYDVEIDRKLATRWVTRWPWTERIERSAVQWSDEDSNGTG
jgi:ParB-like nuclease domain